MTTLNIILQAAASSWGGFPNIIVPALVVLIIIVAVKTGKKVEDAPVSADQTNKVVNVTLIGGIIGLFASSPQSRLNNRIKIENANGWRVVQIIPAESGNIFLSIFRYLLLIITLLFFTTANGYYVLMEKKQ
jgi:hypothetical protein